MLLKLKVFKKYTGIFAISSKDVIGYEVYKKSCIDSNRMVNFINKFINGKYKNKLIILDNACSHRNQLVKDVIKKYNNLFSCNFNIHWFFENKSLFCKLLLTNSTRIIFLVFFINKKLSENSYSHKLITNFYKGNTCCMLIERTIWNRFRI